ncbi:hypothetical protein [Sphingomonas bisphenolicum]|uniref:Uncharacterized protein n=1 Tax=Sphingomonas bisphenolicum TaxID=296544 RepID=A0ABN5W985_9SPHN|nr:hypothetical protein [Sphingomonas bisphenolicum]BBF68839.1 hypothetical protein SBA_ch1_10390 [Sphingomonas bisphenolicum]
MLRFIAYAALAIGSFYGAAAEAEDLYAAYPNAKDEFSKWAICRAGYVGQHFQEKISEALVAEHSADACLAEGQALSVKIIQAKGDPSVFIRKVDAVVRAKVAQLRQRGLPTTPSGEWARCVTTKWKPPASRAGADAALNAAYFECDAEEGKLRAYVKLGAGDAEVPRVIGALKDGMRNQLLLLLEKSQ